jgi:hypothetical protein
MLDVCISNNKKVICMLYLLQERYAKYYFYKLIYLQENLVKNFL